MNATTENAEKVLVGRDGYLFLTNDTNRIIDQIEGRYSLDERQLWATALTHAARRIFCEAHGARYDHVVIPDRETLLTPYLPEKVAPARFGPRPIEQYARLGAQRVHAFGYDLAALRAPAETPSLFKGDTHWTCDGAIRYMRAVMPRIGVDLAAYDAIETKTLSYRNPGDLGSKIGAEAEEAAIRLPQDAALKPAYDNHLPNVGRMRVYRNAARPEQERWLVLHDSFGEWLTLILPLLAHTACFIHTPDWDEIFALDFRPTRVMTFQIERFFVRPPLNGIDYDQLFSEQASMKGTELPLPDAAVGGLLFPGGRHRDAGESPPLVSVTATG